MKRFSIFHAPIFCFFSAAFYRDVALNWKRICFGYLLLLLILCWIPGMIKMHSGFSDFLKNDAPAVISQIPELQIKNGEASTPENRPYLINDPETGKPFFIIDTTGATTSLDDAPDTVKGLVTKTGAIIEKSKIETRTFEFAEIEDFTLTQEKINKWAGMLQKFLIPVILPFAIFGSYVYRIFQALFYSIFALLFAAILGGSGRLTYGAMLRVTVMAMTPAILIQTILGIFSISVPAAWLLYFVVSMGFLFFGIRSAVKEQADATPPAIPT